MAVEFTWDNVVIGSTLSAVTWSQKMNWPVLYNKEPAFFKFKKLMSGEFMYDRWQQIVSDLSLRGLIPFGDKISSIRINQDEIEVFCGIRKYIIFYKNIKFFDGDNI